MSSKLVWLSPVAALGVSPIVFAQAPTESASTLLVRLESAAKFIGFPQVCPGSMPDENEDEGSICLAELYEAKVKVLRHLGGSPTPRYLTVRFTAHSFHAAWQKEVRFLIVAAPFEDEGRHGHFASFWDWENKKGRFCEAPETIARWGNVPLAHLYAKGKQVVTRSDDIKWSAGSSILCVSGREPLAP